ncbi:MAG: hypothetical protein ACQCN6_09615 [Candidatus Bathyarchaeia archaeon]
MKENKNKLHSLLAIAFAVFIVSPLDDLVLAAVFGTAVFGFGSASFYVLLAVSSVVSVIFWKRHQLASILKRHYPKSLQKHKWNGFRGD